MDVAAGFFPHSRVKLHQKMVLQDEIPDKVLQKNHDSIVQISRASNTWWVECDLQRCLMSADPRRNLLETLLRDTAFKFEPLSESYKMTSVHAPQASNAL